jgi:uncharacterized membrane protein
MVERETPSSCPAVAMLTGDGAVLATERTVSDLFHRVKRVSERTGVASESLARGEASVVVPIAQMGFVVTALLGFLFLREPFARKGAGLVAALAALAGLASG